MKQILVTGADGQLGSEIKLLAEKTTEFNFFFTDINTLDITDKNQLDSFFSENNIDYVINCAAYTAVDKAEDEPDIAWLVNVEAVKNLVEICVKYKTFFFHISTDYVFNGKNYSPYKEDHIKEPVSVYGKTKYEAEKVIIRSSVNSIILRISWLYSSFGNNFVKTILKLSKTKKELCVISDQAGTPTYAKDVAKTVLHILTSISNNKYKTNKTEVFHFTGEGICSWYDFAIEIVEKTGADCKIIPIETKEYPTAATRPPYSVLCKTKIKETFGITIRHWKESLEECLTLIN